MRVDADGFPLDGELSEETNALSGMVFPEFDENFRAGFIAIVGRPNVGKSTLTNAMVGAKVAITSGRPETTRRVIRGVVHRPGFQLVLVDTPGIHRPRTLLGRRLNDMVDEALSAIDTAVMCIPANQDIGPGDRRIAAQLASLKCPLICAITKVDTVGRERIAQQILAVQELADFAEIIPLSAVKGDQVEKLVDLLGERMPLSPPLYPEGELSDEPENIMIAELIREAALEGVRDELPHSLAVAVEEIIEQPPRAGKGEGLLKIHVNVYVERDSQKAIIIGRGGERLKAVGTQARRGIEELLGRHVYLDLHVRTAKDWQSDPKMLGRLGF